MIVTKSSCRTILGASLLIVSPLFASERLATVKIANPTENLRLDQKVDLRMVDLGLEEGASEAEFVIAMDGHIPVRAQAWDKNGNGLADTVSVLLDFSPVEETTLDIRVDADAAQANIFPPRTFAEISRKFGGEWEGQEYHGGEFENVRSLTTPPNHKDHSYYIRYEGPGWESDKVGYRFYLDWRNGFDIFGKLTPAMVLKDVGQDGFDSYHEPADWGMDILKVGSSLGSGGYGIWVDGAAERISKTQALTCEILENGPVLSQFRTTYQGWEGAGQEKMDLVADISIHAGSRLSWVRLRPSEQAEKFCAGLVKHEGNEVFTGSRDITGEAYTYLASWGPQALDGSDMGMAILVREKNLDKFTSDDQNELAVFDRTIKGVEYAFLAAWSKEPGGIKSKEAFEAYLEETARDLTIAPRVTVYSKLDEKLTQGKVDSENALHWTKVMADSILKRRGSTLAHEQYDPEAERVARWTYTTGLISKAVHDLALATGEESYAEWAESVISSYVNEDGSISTYDFHSYNIDQVNSGKMLLQLYKETGERRYRIAADEIRQQLEEHPKTKNGAFWHKKRYPWQVWLDGVYMGIPFLVGYELAFNGGEELELALHEFLVVEEQLRDPESGLYWHAWDEAREQVWADPETGRSKYFWGRGLGWYAMALVDVLEMLPEDSEESKQMQRLLNDLAEALVKVQDPETGVWYQILNMPDAPGNYLESSASSMFTYMLAKGVNYGWLDDRYRENVREAWEGMLTEFVSLHPDGTTSLTHICRVAGLGFGRDGSYEYYMSEPVVENDPKGIGPFVMAGLQVSEMLKN
ncbi:glycoside hydrolase family 88 protein [Pelagicoccus sp. SDUM812003]|uniref:glycoside hydrolase family 88 protein n=1 Tax=Pelagicoccus sp. SDUM812003 TaxID=3041267 RepID=UPI0028101B95|nr:glycoside hydrolase family 88 protein [Pelagicoccus sp. SDUM812003]MDQ8205372.1 glycoside hydrolase family 88 protein [Pelagicoccus sp. SDUM812003]